MEWREVGSTTIDAGYPLRGGRVTSDLWLFRGVDEVWAWRETENKLLWRHPLGHDALLGGALAVRDTLAYALAVPGEGMIELVAIEIRSGKRRWAKEWPLQPFNKGSVATSSALFLLGDDANYVPALVEIKPDTGAEVSIHRVPEGSFALGVAEDRLFIISEKGIFEWRKNEAHPILERDDIREFSILGPECAVGVWSLSESYSRLVMLDLRTVRVTAELDCGMVQTPKPIALGAGRVLVTPGKRDPGLRLWDVHTNRILWQRETPGSVVEAGVVGRVIVALALHEDLLTSAHATDLETGTELPPPPGTSFATRKVFAAGDTVVLAHSGQLAAWSPDLTDRPAKAERPSTRGNVPTETDSLAPFSTLGVATYRAALPEGRIEWLNGDGVAVASGSCRVIASYAADRSFQWGWANKDLVAAGVPVIQKGDGEPRLSDLDAEEAEALAYDAAVGAGCAFVYRAKAGAVTIFLGISDFQAGKGAPAVAKESVATALTSFGKLASERAIKLLGAGGDRETVTAALKSAAAAVADTAAAWNVDVAAEGERLRALAARVEAGAKAEDLGD
jgi:hypothetical protein